MCPDADAIVTFALEKGIGIGQPDVHPLAGGPIDMAGAIVNQSLAEWTWFVLGADANLTLLIGSDPAVPAWTIGPTFAIGGEPVALTAVIDDANWTAVVGIADASGLVRILRIDPETHGLVSDEELALGAGPADLWLWNEAMFGPRLLVASQTASTLTSYDVASDAITAIESYPGGPRRLALAAGGPFGFVMWPLVVALEAHDAVVLSPYMASGHTWLYPPYVTVDVAAGPVAAAGGDVDGDGWGDIVSVSPTSGVSVAFSAPVQ